MDAGGEVTLLADEKFDFDISLSPSSAHDDDEVFIGPIRHKERCVSVAIKSPESEENSPPGIKDPVTWSPLSGDKFVEIFKEAHLLALQLECFSSDGQKKEPLATEKNETVEKFVQESKSKLNILDNVNDCVKTPVALKRETYCVQDSPFNQLPPSIQQRFAAPCMGDEKKSDMESPKRTGPMPKCAKQLAVSPLAQKTKTSQLKNTGARGNAEKPTGSRLQALKVPGAQAKNNRLTVEKPKAVKKLSPVRRKPLNSSGSTEDLLSDKSSVASDVSDSSFNSSTVGKNKRTLPAPKPGLKKPQFKQPSTGLTFRKHTSSSSSSHSSMNSSLNSSLSFSPTGGNAKQSASLNTSVSSSRLTNPSRLALIRPTTGSTSLKTSSTGLLGNQPKPNGTAKVSTIANSSKPSVSVVKPQTPAGKMQKQISAPNLHRPTQNKPESAVKGVSSTKPQARVMPTPTTRLKLPQKPGGASPDCAVVKPLQPTRLMSCGEIGSGIAESTPMRPTQTALQNPSFSARSIPATPGGGRLSALPTPLGRRTSGIPTTTPKTIPRTFSALRPSLGLQASSKAIKKPLVSRSAATEGSNTGVVKSPCSSCEEENVDASSVAVACSLNFSPEEKNNLVDFGEIEKPVAFPQSTEGLLIDIEAGSDSKVRKPSSIGSDSQPLIDLSNTPDFNKKLMPFKAVQTGQLIDFGSPLIMLSPTVNKENMAVNSPLLMF
ncbi:G2 and S phase-expressed protein 1 [Bombina bombina]|uniref:G2 and S phase-expressed protein 1 n=1 Tax=Bombina bombina TaxID=8345 RepID=UPI00235A7462|nr:G2 and S phase-expressed protein 1 [Bombina bombina]